jgi:hypothetical protein
MFNLTVENAQWLDADTVARRLAVPREQLVALVKIGRIPEPTYGTDPLTPMWSIHGLDVSIARWRGETIKRLSAIPPPERGKE